MTVPGAGPDARIGAVSILQRRILRLFQRRGLLEQHTVDDMLTWQGTGGFSLDAGVHRVFCQPGRPTPDGRTLLALSPLEFLDALSRLIPPPRVHRHLTVTFEIDRNGAVEELEIYVPNQDLWFTELEMERK